MKKRPEPEAGGGTLPAGPVDVRKAYEPAAGRRLCPVLAGDPRRESMDTVWREIRGGHGGRRAHII
ncbi:MAG TPA: hypothetical protein VG605_16935 [Puia sp.]|nr:hypothetical protein [Puia sp.]